MSAPTRGTQTHSIPVNTTGTTWVIGDGTTAAGRARARTRAFSWTGIVLLALAIGALVMALTTTRTSDLPLGADNPQPNGARALVEVLRGQGVTVEQVRSLDDAIARAQPGTTLAITDTWNLDVPAVNELATTGADLVLLEPTNSALATLSDDGLRMVVGLPADPTARGANCADDDARAADAIAEGSSRLEALSAESPTTGSPTTGATVCFTDDEGRGAYATTAQNGRTVRVIASADSITNASITNDGNAALALRALGTHATVTWYVPQPTAAVAVEDVSVWGLFPPWMRYALVQALIAAGVAMLWLGRRFGPLVAEPLPVSVKTAETTRGRAQLYRAARDYPHAAAALRGASAARLAHRTSLPPSAGRQDLVAHLARVTGRPAAEVDRLLYGPSPQNQDELIALVRDLDTLERQARQT